MPQSSFARLDAAASLGMFTYASSVVVTPIILLRIAEELSFGLAQGGGIEAVRAGFLVAVLVASGAAAARFGKAHSLGAGGIVLSAGLFAYALAPSYAVVLVAIILVGLGGGVLEALLNPLVQDAHPENSGRYLNIVNAFFSVGIMTSVLLVGDLLTRGVSWRLLVAALGALAGLSGILFFFFGSARRSATPQPVDRSAIDASGYLPQPCFLAAEPKVRSPSGVRATRSSTSMRWPGEVRWQLRRSPAAWWWVAWPPAIWYGKSIFTD